MAAFIFGIGALLGSTAPGWAASPYDGTWSAVVVCSDFGDVKGYTWRFPVRVIGGRLSGKFVNPEDSLNYGDLTGAIGGSGDALLTMKGSTGPSVYAVYHPGPHTRIHYAASAHFDATSGSGARIEQRPCSLSFTKN